MSLGEMERLVAGLTEMERSALRDILNAAEEGMSVEEFRAMTAALDEALNDPSAPLPSEQVFAELRALYPSTNAGSTP
jgi:hypothetical protein